MKKFLTMAAALAVFASLSTVANASGPMRKNPVTTKTTVETKMPGKRETMTKETVKKDNSKKETMKKEIKGTKTGGAAPIKHKKHYKTNKKH